MSTTDLTVIKSRTVATVQPRSRAAFELPKDKDRLGSERLRENEELLLGLSADLRVRGPDSVRLANSTHLFFQDMLATLEQSGRTASRRTSTDSVSAEEEFSRHLARSFHQHLTKVLQSQPPVLRRSPSTVTLLTDFTNVEGLLAQGVETYIAAVRKILRSRLRELQVDVALHKYNFTVRDEHLSENNDQLALSQQETVGGKCLNLFCGLCLCTSAVVKKLVGKSCQHRGAESPTVQPLLSSISQSRSDGTVQVLKDVTCLVKSGRLTLVLGPPGSGKTSLLKAMSGQLLRTPGTTKTTGELTYNGRPVSTLKHLPNWVAYASQNDEHMPLLTVRETLTHAFKCRKEIRFTDEQLLEKVRNAIGQDAAERMAAFKDLDIEVILAVLGLTRCANNVIGNETLKGISGGERRRVTLGEMLAVGTQVLCLDEISTGLDSAATFDICQYLRHVAHIMDQCVVVALLQPPPEVMNLFDDVLVIAEGQIIYHGERAKMMEYFENLGFRCPPRKDVGDFLQELPTKNGAAFALSPQELKELGLPKPPRTANEFAARWKQSEMFKNEDAQVRLSMSKFTSMVANTYSAERQSQSQQVQMFMSTSSDSNHADGLDMDELPENPWYVQLRLAMGWMWRYRMKDTVKLKAKLAQNLVMGVLFGTVFYQIPMDEAYQKNILILNVLMFSSQTAIPEVQSNAQARSIYHKHIDQGFYKAWMLALAQTVTCLPLVMFDTLVFGDLIYWLTGLAPQAESFLLFFFVATLFGATMQSIMGMFSYMIRDQNKAMIAAVMVYITSILMSGVVATEGVIPFYLKPLFHLNPLAWAFRTLANIEFLSPGYDENPCPVSLNGKHINVPQRCGDFFLSSRQIAVGWKYVWEGIAVSALYMVVCWLITAISLTFIRFQPPRGKQTHGGGGDGGDSQGVGVPADNDEEDPSVHGSGGHAPLRRQQSLTAETTTLVVHDLGYSIKSPAEKDGRIDLLKNISCFALPGRMLALMGASGAGKTTLLDVLAGIKTVGKARGSIYLNGRPLRQSDFTRVAGYVQQFGVHSLTSTIRESLEFSLALRLPGHVLPTKEERQLFVDETLELLELKVIEDQLAGQCSMEQNKRLTLGVELVANPSIVFADEPTSSLDARAAAIVMRVLQKVARSGRVVIATIHQPSIAIFQRFDDLLLLKKGGQVVFFGELGPESRNLIEYFESIPGVPSCPDGANPAAWMLEIIGGGTGIRRPRGVSSGGGRKPRRVLPKRQLSLSGSPMVNEDDGGDEESGIGSGGGNNALAEEGAGHGDDVNEEESPDEDLDFAVMYRNSRLRRTNEERIRNEFGIPLENFSGGDSSTYAPAAPTTSMVFQQQSSSSGGGSNRVKRTAPGSVSSYTVARFRTSYVTQFRYVLARNFTELWRSPDFSFLRFVVITAFALMFVAIFFQQKVGNMADIQSRILCITFSMSLGSMFTMMTLIPFTINRRALFYRERGAGMYHSAIYSMAAGFSEVPYLLVSALLVVNIVYWGVGYSHDAFPFEYFFASSFIYLMMMAFVGMLMASILPEPLSAQLAASAFFSIMNTFAGISVPLKRIPTPYVWIHYLSPLRWYFEGILSTQFHGNDAIMCNPLGKPVESGLLHAMKLCTTTGAPDFKQVSGVQVTIEEFVLHDFLEGFKYERRWMDLGILLCWIVGLRILAVLATSYISFDKR